MEGNETCAICEDEFADEYELKNHANEIHRKSTDQTKPIRSAPPPKRLANQLFEEYDTLKNSKFKSYWIIVQQIMPTQYLPYWSLMPLFFT